MYQSKYNPKLTKYKRKLLKRKLTKRKLTKYKRNNRTQCGGLNPLKAAVAAAAAATQLATDVWHNKYENSIKKPYPIIPHEPYKEPVAHEPYKEPVAHEPYKEPVFNWQFDFYNGQRDNKPEIRKEMTGQLGERFGFGEKLYSKNTKFIVDVCKPGTCVTSTEKQPYKNKQLQMEQDVYARFPNMKPIAEQYDEEDDDYYRHKYDWLLQTMYAKIPKPKKLDNFRVYQGTSYVRINAHLKYHNENAGDTFSENEVSKMMSEFDQIDEFKDDVELWRGAFGDDCLFQEVNGEHYFSSLGLLSSSFLPLVAERFQQPGREGSCVFRINGKGAKLLRLGNVAEEIEVIFPPNTIFKRVPTPETDILDDNTAYGQIPFYNKGPFFDLVVVKEIPLLLEQAPPYSGYNGDLTRPIGDDGDDLPSLD